MNTSITLVPKDIFWHHIIAPYFNRQMITSLAGTSKYYYKELVENFKGLRNRLATSPCPNTMPISLFKFFALIDGGRELSGKFKEASNGIKKINEGYADDPLIDAEDMYKAAREFHRFQLLSLTSSMFEDDPIGNNSSMVFIALQNVIKETETVLCKCFWHEVISLSFMIIMIIILGGAIISSIISLVIGILTLKVDNSYSYCSYGVSCVAKTLT